VSPFTATFLVTLLAFAGLWWIGTRRGDVSIVDVYWGPGFAVIAAVGLALGAGTNPRAFIVVTLVAMWGFRLGAYLAWRKLQMPGEDFRYAAMRRRAGADFTLQSLATVFGLQAVLMWVVSLPVQWAVTTPSSEELGIFDVLGMLAWGVGLALESIGDLQLIEFRANPANAGKVLDRGLWRYTRHPNYFGDCCVWWGFYAFAVATPNGWWTFIGPVLMTGLLLRVSGVPLLERSLLARKPGYAAYVARTSGFVPRLPRRVVPEVESAPRSHEDVAGTGPQEGQGA
jgi:steroid 5-alpha reductase family enzyme